VTTTHTPNDQIFGVQLKINALTSGQRKYNNTSTLLSSVLSQRQHRKVKDAKEFSLRTKIVDEILLNILNEKLEHRTSTVGRVLNTFAKNLHLRFKVKDWEDVACCSSKTLERYFMEVCGMSPKQAMNMLRVRQAASDLADDPKSFNLFSYGYYDRSHFNKDLRRFLMS
jgi:transcriptional regulator GlxA family with amidase domain